jgi:TetR/AcrR family transcriptional regulator, regulator of autoinduction and epiphytic fitness
VSRVTHDEPPRRGRGQARTRLARRAVVAAARTLFAERGYAATTVEVISNVADVPAATIYRLFTSKLGILKALLDTSIAGDDKALTVQERSDVASLFGEPDPIKLLAGSAGVTTAINQRSYDVYRVLMGAASSEPAAVELLDEVREQRKRGQRQIAHALDRSNSFRDGLKEHEAVDLIYALMSPEVYRLLVVDRNWSPEKYQQWLATALVRI